MEKLVQQLLEEMQGMKADVKDVKAGQVRLENRVDNIDSKIEKLETRFDGVDSKIEKLELRIENEVIEKVRALYDARSVNLDYFESIRDSLARIEENTDSLRRRTSNHEFKLLEHDREIRLLRMELKNKKG